MAILRCIGTIVVKAVKRIFHRGFWPQISIKGFEGHKPSFADNDPTSAITCISWIVWIKAALSHGVPCMMLRRMAQAMSLSMTNDESNWLAFNPSSFCIILRSNSCSLTTSTFTKQEGHLQLTRMLLKQPSTRGSPSSIVFNCRILVNRLLQQVYNSTSILVAGLSRE